MPTQPDQPNSPTFFWTMGALNVLDADGSPGDFVLTSGQSFQLSIDFALGGFASILATLAAPFTVTYFYEQIGAVNSGTLAVVNGNLVSGVTNYPNAGNTGNIAVSAPLVPGIYRLGAIADITTSVNGFADGPLIEVV